MHDSPKLLVVKWLGRSVTIRVGVRVRVRAGDREWTGLNFRTKFQDLSNTFVLLSWPEAWSGRRKKILISAVQTVQVVHHPAIQYNNWYFVHHRQLHTVP